jgi:hypothetical protein
LITIVDGDGNPWWVASEVCDYLGYKNSPGAVAKHSLNPQKMTVAKRYGQNGGAQFKTIINESDLYRPDQITTAGGYGFLALGARRDLPDRDGELTTIANGDGNPWWA